MSRTPSASVVRIHFDAGGDEEEELVQQKRGDASQQQHAVLDERIRKSSDRVSTQSLGSISSPSAPNSSNVSTASQSAVPAVAASGDSSDVSTQTLPVPSYAIGIVVGQNGDTLRQLQQTSGAQIHVPATSTGDSYPVELSGSSAQTSHAKQLIQDIVKSADQHQGSKNHVINHAQALIQANHISASPPVSSTANNEVVTIEVHDAVPPSKPSVTYPSGTSLVNPPPAAHKAKSVSHWHDSRISVEMHLALYIEDLMLLAPGAAAEKVKLPAAEGQLADGTTSGALPEGHVAPAAPVEFDEDAEPDITLQHVLAGVEYLLHTRIIGSANPNAELQRGIAEEEEGEEDEDGEKLLDERKQEHTDEEKASPEMLPPAHDAHGMPVPLAEAPAVLLDAAVTNSVQQVGAPTLLPSSKNSPYFYFVSLDLSLCDDLLTALCYHMRRAEVAWSLRPKASAEAKKALELFEGFFTYVYSFRCAVAARPTSYLRASLKVARHMRSSDPLHRRLVVRLLILLEKECPRIEKWQELVDADDHDKVSELLSTREMRKLRERLVGQDETAAEREESVSKRNAFETARADARENSQSKGANASNSTSVLKTFPAFYSVRHNKLLPPKGAMFDVEPKRLLNMFQSDTKNGLKKEEIEERQKMYGKNELPPPYQPSFLRLLWDQIKDFIILVLLAAAIVSAAIQDWEAAGVLLVVVIINVIIGLVQEYRSANALKALSSFSIPQATVIRDGEISVEPASELVPGDVVVLEEGANVPADLRLVEVSQLFTIEAILTGESLPVLKSTAAIKLKNRRFLPVGDRVNMAFMSTLVSKGRAVGVVVNTGATTEVGKIYSALSASAEDAVITPLQRKLAALGKALVIVSMVACAAIIAIGVGRGYGTDIIKIGISLAVSVIPEGLVTVVTLTMAIGTQRMAKRKAIARNLPAVETLGALTTICSDKTGTLTEGKMKTERMWAVAFDDKLQSTNKDGHIIKFVTASKVKSLASNPSNASKDAALPNGSAAPSAGSAAADPAVSTAPPAAANALPPVSVVLNDSLTVKQVSDLPIPLQWNNLICCLNNNASVKMQDVLNADGTTTQEEVLVGDATEVALLRAAQQSNCDVNYWTKRFGLKRHLEFAFDSDRKRMSVILELPPAEESNSGFLDVERPANAKFVLLVKGAPEAVLNKSVSYMRPVEGSSLLRATKLTDPVEESIEKQGSSLAGLGMRVLATAFRFLSEEQVAKFQADLAKANAEAEAGAAAAATADPDGKKDKEAPSGPSGADLISFDAEKDLVFVGLAGIMDPPRVEVKDAIRVAHTAGIRVCMITGDHFDTACAIARQIGILDERRGDRAMNGDALAVLSEEQLAALDPFPVVFSRVSPENKLKLVKSLQRRGEIAAMTGDGVNDSPAIKAADVGIAMGLAGTEVTRQSADIILSDDNFSTIVASVGEGRRIYDNIVKFLVYLLTCNGAEVWVMLFAVILKLEVPFLSLMLLWANIFADVAPSLALGLEEMEASALTRSPRKVDGPVLSKMQVIVIMWDSIIMSIIILVNYWHQYVKRDIELEIARSYAFLQLALIHIVHSLEAKSLTESAFTRKLHSSNPAMIPALLFSACFMILGLYIPGLNSVLELKPIDGLEWGIIFINIAAFVALVEFRKWVLRVWDRRYGQVNAKTHFQIQAERAQAEEDAAREKVLHIAEIQMAILPAATNQQ